MKHHVMTTRYEIKVETFYYMNISLTQVTGFNMFPLEFQDLGKTG